jgi:hypothetical protein
MKRTLTLIGVVLLAAMISVDCSDSPGDPAQNIITKIDKEPTDTYFGPMITIDEPARAGMIKEGSLDNSLVDLSGIACDSFQTITNLEINGSKLSLTGADPCETLDLQQISRWGLSIIHGKILNDIGWEGRLAHSFLRSPDYLSPTADDPKGQAESGLLIQLNQEFIDDGDNADLDDVAGIMQHYVNEFVQSGTFQEVVPRWFITPSSADNEDPRGQADKTKYCCGPINCWPSETNYETSIEFTRGTISTGTVSTDINLIEEGMEVDLRISSIRVPVTVRAHLDLKCLGETNTPISRTITLSNIRALVRTKVELDETTGLPVVSVTSHKFTINGLDPAVSASQIISGIIGQLDLGFVNDAIKAITGKDLIGSVGDWAYAKVVVPLQNWLPDLVEGQLEDYLGKLTQYVAKNYNLPEPIDMKVKVTAGFDWVDFNADRAQLATYIHAQPETPLAAHSAPYGAIVYGGSRPEIDTDRSVLGVGIKYDFLNQFLWAIWQGGGFDIDSDDLVAFGYIDADDLDGIQLSIFSNLPPVLMPGDGTGKIDIGWGDMFIDVTLTSSAVARMAAAEGRDLDLSEYAEELPHVEAYVSAIAGGSLAVNMDTYKISTSLNQATTEIYVQVSKIHDPLIRGFVNTLLQTTLQRMIPKYLNDVLGSFDLPEFKVKGVRFKLQDVEVEQLNGYQCISGGVVGTEE